MLARAYVTDRRRVSEDGVRISPSAPANDNSTPRRAPSPKASTVALIGSGLTFTAGAVCGVVYGVHYALKWLLG